jgi:hypothetical protein
VGLLVHYRGWLEPQALRRAPEFGYNLPAGPG